MKSSLQNPKTSLRRKLHEILRQLIGDIVLAVVDDPQLCLRRSWPAPNIGGSVAAHVDVHVQEVVRLGKQVRSVFNIEIHTGYTSFVEVPGNMEYG